MFHNMADDRSGTAWLFIIVTAGGWKVLKEANRESAFLKLDNVG